jgi:hypothetical protein
VDGVLLKAELPYGQWSVAVVFDAAGLLDGQAARCALTPPKPAEDDTTGKGVEDGKGGEDDAVGGEPVAFEPPAGTRAARREAFARARPVLYASRHVVVAAGKVLFPLLGLGALVRLLLALVPRPDVDLPDIDLPSPPGRTSRGRTSRSRTCRICRRCRGGCGRCWRRRSSGCRC